LHLKWLEFGSRGQSFVYDFPCREIGRALMQTRKAIAVSGR